MSVKIKEKKTRNFRSLTATLAIAFLGLSAIVLLIAGSLDMYFNFQNQQKLFANEQQLIAQDAANRVKSFIQEKLKVLEATVSLGDFLNIQQEEHKITLEKLLGLEPAFRQLVLLDTQKQEIAKVSRLSNSISYGFSRRIEDNLFSLISQGKAYIGSVYIDEITSEPMVIMASPVKDVFGDFKGILMAEVNLKFMWDLVGRIKIGNKGVAYVVDKQGKLIAFGDISRVLKGENLAHLAEVNEFVKGDELNHKGSADVVTGIQGTKVVTNHAHLGIPDWAVVVELPVLEAYKTVIIAFIISALIMLLSFALAIVVGIYLSKRITKPIISLRDAAIRIGKGKLDTQIEIKTKNEIEDLASSFNEMAKNLQQTTTSVDNLNREIAERKKVEDALRKAEEKYRMQFEGALDAIFIADAETGIITDCNPAATRLADRAKSELVGQHQRILHPPEIIEGEFSRTFKEHLGEKQDQTVETQIVTKKGEIRDVAVKANLLEIRGKKLLQGIFRDVTEHKQAEQRQEQLLEQLEKINQELKDFAYIVSHDLKAPLRGISTLVKWISTDYADKFDQEGKEQMDLLLNRVERMHNLIDGILQYSRVGRVKEEKTQVNLNELVPDIVDMLAPPENITITIENELPMVECEKTRIMQVFQNLLSNAIKYMDKPRGHIRVGCVEEENCWRFSIADNGPGIEEKYFEKIFQIFQTLRPRDEVESTGVGLTVVKKIIEMYGGKIWVESVVDKGSTFLFTLPKQMGRINNEKLEAGIIS
jgi:PAS domain S-box-containing protein